MSKGAESGFAYWCVVIATFSLSVHSYSRELQQTEPVPGINLLPRQLLLKMHNGLQDTNRFASSIDQTLPCTAPWDEVVSKWHPRPSSWKSQSHSLDRNNLCWVQSCPGGWAQSGGAAFSWWPWCCKKPTFKQTFTKNTASISSWETSDFHDVAFCY